MKREHAAAWIFVAVFFVLCLFPSVGMPFYHSQLAENRVLSKKPVLWTAEGTWNRDYFQDLQTYVSEHFAFRGELVAADSMIKYKLLRTPCDDQVIIGKDGWLFFGETLADYAGVTLTERELDQIVKKMSEVCDYVQSRGKQPLFVIVPNKNQIYPEYMPMRFGSKAKQRNLTLLQEKLQKAGVPYVDANKVLLEGKTQDELYLHEDTHWNNTGARLVLNEIYRLYGLSDNYPLTGYTIEESHSPDLYNILFPKTQHCEAQRIYDDAKSYDYIGRLHSFDDITIRTQAADGNGKSILVYRDSFGRAMIPYMGGTFDNAVFNRSTPYDLSLAEDLDCDYVLFEIVERNLEDLGRIEIPQK